MENSSLSCLDGLSDIGLRSGVDMRPTLIRVLTDLYVQKLTHTPDEERHYTELALRLLEAVDVPTRAAVATRLARHLSPPPRVMQVLARDLPEVAAALRPQPAVQPPSAANAAPLHRRGHAERRERRAGSHAQCCDQRNGTRERLRRRTTRHRHRRHRARTQRVVLRRERRRTTPHTAAISMSSPARRRGQSTSSHEAAVGQRLETAALGRNREEFSRQLARSLQISREQALRIAHDECGEPIVVAAKALSVARDMLYRILLFVNPTVGHSVERVHALAELYDDVTLQAAEDMVATWQALHGGEREAATHRPLAVDDDTRPKARPSAATCNGRRPRQRRNERRDAS